MATKSFHLSLKSIFENEVMSGLRGKVGNTVYPQGKYVLLKKIPLIESNYIYIIQHYVILI